MTVDPRDSASSAADAIARATSAVPIVPESVRRALACVGRGIYKLGTGGRHPDRALPFDDEGRADCSGFVSWSLGLDRKSDAIDGGWISCDSMVRDALGPRRMFAPVPVGEVRAGDVLVYPGRYLLGRRVAIGHTALVVAVSAVVRTFADCSIVECQASTKPAVRMRDGGLWARKAGGIAVRLRAA